MLILDSQTTVKFTPSPTVLVKWLDGHGRHCPVRDENKEVVRLRLRKYAPGAELNPARSPKERSYQPTTSPSSVKYDD